MRVQLENVHYIRVVQQILMGCIRVTVLQTHSLVSPVLHKVTAEVGCCEFENERALYKQYESHCVKQLLHSTSVTSISSHCQQLPSS